MLALDKYYQPSASKRVNITADTNTALGVRTRSRTLPYRDNNENHVASVEYDNDDTIEKCETETEDNIDDSDIDMDDLEKPAEVNHYESVQQLDSIFRKQGMRGAFKGRWNAFINFIKMDTPTNDTTNNTTVNGSMMDPANAIQVRSDMITDCLHVSRYGQKNIYPPCNDLIFLQYVLCRLSTVPAHKEQAYRMLGKLLTYNKRPTKDILNYQNEVGTQKKALSRIDMDASIDEENEDGYGDVPNQYMQYVTLLCTWKQLVDEKNADSDYIQAHIFSHMPAI